MTPAAVRVERGAAWLDQTLPDWWAHIELDRLDMADGCNCILGQTGRNIIEAITGQVPRPYEFRSDYIAVRALVPVAQEAAWAEDNGFTANAAELERLWAEQAARRRTETTPA